MKKIYIMVSNSGSIVSKFLVLATQEKYVHVSISLDKNLKKVYSFGRKHIHFPLPGGLIEENMIQHCNHFTNSYCKIYEIEVTNKQYYQIKNDLKKNYLKEQVKYRYNIIGLPLIKFNKVHHRKYHYACSQFCGKLLIDNQIINFDKDYSIIKPYDFLDLQNLKLIFDGKTKDYIK